MLGDKSPQHAPEHLQPMYIIFLSALVNKIGDKTEFSITRVHCTCKVYTFYMCPVSTVISLYIFAVYIPKRISLIFLEIQVESLFLILTFLQKYQNQISNFEPHRIGTNIQCFSIRDALMHMLQLLWSHRNYCFQKRRSLHTCIYEDNQNTNLVQMLFAQKNAFWDSPIVNISYSCLGNSYTFNLCSGKIEDGKKHLSLELDVPNHR